MDAACEPVGFARPPARHVAMHPYPTPPDSQPPSVHRLKLSDASLSDGEGAPRPLKHALSTSDSITLQSLKRASTNPLAGVVTPSSVHAAHLSSAGALARLVSSSQRVCDNVLDLSIARLKMLTRDAVKSAPTTPKRALSNHTARSDASGPSDHEKNVQSLTSDSSALENDASTAGPKGKLFVKILEARGLRKSWDPYVVAVFQRNELVSGGPRAAEADETDEITSNPMSRSGSDTGRPMAIPMKSRQSSNVSIVVSEVRDKSRAGRSMTNPKWDTEAVL